MTRWKETVTALDEVHEFLTNKSGRGGKLVMDQVALAGEFGMSHDRMHRLTKMLIQDGRLKVIGTGQRGVKTVVVKDG